MNLEITCLDALVGPAFLSCGKAPLAPYQLSGSRALILDNRLSSQVIGRMATIFTICKIYLPCCRELDL
jgi:hypothetical protein